MASHLVKTMSKNSLVQTVALSARALQEPEEGDSGRGRGRGHKLAVAVVAMAVAVKAMML